MARVLVVPRPLIFDVISNELVKGQPHSGHQQVVAQLDPSVSDALLYIRLADLSIVDSPLNTGILRLMELLKLVHCLVHWRSEPSALHLALTWQRSLV